MKALLPWATSVGTLLGMWLVGQKRSIGWAVGLLNQALWVSFAVVFRAWGLLPLSAALTVIYVRALLAWRRDERVARANAPQIVRVSADELDGIRVVPAAE